MIQRAEFAFTRHPGGGRRRREGGRKFRFLVMGRFGAAEQTAAFSTHRIDVDNFDAVLAKLAPCVSFDAALAGDADRARLAFTAMEHFHPDHLIRTLPGLRRLRELSRELDDPATEAAALAELRRIAGGAAKAEGSGDPSGAGSAGAPAVPDDAEPSAESDDALFGRLLGRTPDRGAARHRPGAGPGTGGDSGRRARETVQRLIRDALGASEEASSAKDSGSASHQAAYARGEVAALLTEDCREALLQPEFRDLERAWRSVHWLVSRLEDDQAEVHLLDLSKAALGEHLGAFRERLDASPLQALLCERDGTGWDLVVADYAFGLNADDLLLLATLGALAGRARTPVVGHGELSLAGCPGPEAVEAPWDWQIDDEALAALWTQLRAHPAAEWIGLAAPRFLLRQPYGARSDPIESFEFEELPSRPERERFLWANPAFACAWAMAEAGAGGAARGLVGDLPAALFDDGGGQAIQPPVEFLLTERARAAAEHSGLIVCTGGRNSNQMAVGALRGLGPA